MDELQLWVKHRYGIFEGHFVGCPVSQETEKIIICDGETSYTMPHEDLLFYLPDGEWGDLEECHFAGMKKTEKPYV